MPYKRAYTAVVVVPDLVHGAVESPVSRVSIGSPVGTSYSDLTYSSKAKPAAKTEASMV